MAKTVFTGQYLSLNATTIHTLGVLKKAELKVEAADVDVTNHNSSGYTEFLGGLKSGTLDLEFFQDFANSALDSIMWPLLGTVVAFELRPTTSSVSTSNPKWTGNVLIKEWGFEGSVGDAAGISVSFPTSGAVTRATS